MAAERLVKLYVELPNHFGTGGESLWAAPLEGDRYELRNVPFRAYGLHFLDVVEARPGAGGRIKVLRVVQPGGHRTLRVHFLREATPDHERIDILRRAERLGASFEAATRAYFAFDVPPEGRHDALVALLRRLQDDGVLEYETCEARVPGGFDVEPGDEEDPFGPSGGELTGDRARRGGDRSDEAGDQRADANADPPPAQRDDDPGDTPRER